MSGTNVRLVIRYDKPSPHTHTLSLPPPLHLHLHSHPHQTFIRTRAHARACSIVGRGDPGHMHIVGRGDPGHIHIVGRGDPGHIHIVGRGDPGHIHIVGRGDPGHMQALASVRPPLHAHTSIPQRLWDLVLHTVIHTRVYTPRHASTNMHAQHMPTRTRISLHARLRRIWWSCTQ